MLTEQAIVTRCDDRQVEVELQRQSACSGCELNEGCGTGALGRLLGHRGKPLVIESEQNLKPGDRVTLALPENTLVKASLMLYGLPLLGMILAGSIAYGLFDAPEWLVALASGGGFYAGFRLASNYSQKLPRGVLIPGIVGIDVNHAGETRS